MSHVCRDAIIFNPCLLEQHNDLQKIKDVKETKLTIGPQVIIKTEMKEGKKEITIKIEGNPGVSLDGKRLADGRNLGPYIEELTYKIIPVANAVFLKATPGGTREDSVKKDYSATGSRSVTLGNTGMEGAIVGSATFSQNNSQAFSVTEGDFDIETRRRGDTIVWSKRIHHFMQDNTWKNYDPDHLELICSYNYHHHFWINTLTAGNHSPVGVIGNVPDAARSSFQFAAEATFLKTSEKADFKIECEAKVVFISNQVWQMRHETSFPANVNDRRYYHRATHKVWKNWSVLSDDSVTQTEYEHVRNDNGYMYRHVTDFDKLVKIKKMKF